MDVALMKNRARGGKRQAARGKIEEAFTFRGAGTSVSVG
jgi:hypothetical protein